MLNLDSERLHQLIFREWDVLLLESLAVQLILHFLLELFAFFHVSGLVDDIDGDAGHVDDDAFGLLPTWLGYFAIVVFVEACCIEAGSLGAMDFDGLAQVRLRASVDLAVDLRTGGREWLGLRARLIVDCAPLGEVRYAEDPLEGSLVVADERRLAGRVLLVRVGR